MIYVNGNHSEVTFFPIYHEELLQNIAECSFLIYKSQKRFQNITQTLSPLEGTSVITTLQSKRKIQHVLSEYWKEYHELYGFY